MSIRSPSSFFTSIVHSAHILRTRNWDNAATHSDALQLALGDINLLRGCLDAIDGCQEIEPGAVVEFQADGKYNMTRETQLVITTRKRIEDLAKPDEFFQLLQKSGSDRKLRAAFCDLTPNTPWIDIYRIWESIKDYHGGEHKMLRYFKGEEKRIKQLTRTANSFRHVKTYDIVPDPMPHQEAIAYLKDLLLRTTASRGLPPVADKFEQETPVRVPDYAPGSDNPAVLNKLSIVPGSGAVPGLRVQIGTGKSDL